MGAIVIAPLTMLGTRPDTVENGTLTGVGAGGTVVVGGVDAVWGARDEEWSVRTEDEGVVSADVVDVTVPGR